MTYQQYLEGILGLDRSVSEYISPLIASGIGLGADAVSRLQLHEYRHCPVSAASAISRSASGIHFRVEMPVSPGISSRN